MQWTSVQKNALRTFFNKQISTKKDAKKGECEAFITKHPSIAGIGWLKVKTFVFNEYRLK